MGLLKGFRMTMLNALFVEKPSDAHQIAGRETYWTEKGDLFLFYNAQMRTWAVEKARRYEQVIDGRSQGVAHSPKGYELSSTSAAPVEGWYEWNKEITKWILSPGSGVARRGRVRRMQGPHSRGAASGPPSEV